MTYKQGFLLVAFALLGMSFILYFCGPYCEYPVKKEDTYSKRIEECLEQGGRYTLMRSTRNYGNLEECDITKTIKYED